MAITLPSAAGGAGNNPQVIGGVVAASLVGLATLAVLLRSVSEPARLSRQASIRMQLEQEEDESESMDDPRPFVAQASLQLTKDVLMPLNQNVRGPLERPEDVEMDGPSLVGSDFGFSGLRSFGSGLVEHVKMKIRCKLGLQEVILIDSPGMIDSPADGNNQQKQHDRGYDFEGVARWFAERADLLIVLNKADMFQRSADFARSYGALCWNLAKVIPRKDLPRIFTTYTPNTSTAQTPSTISKEQRSELDVMRGELINEITLAPFRRMDNHITTLFDSSRALKMHSEILLDVRQSYRLERRRHWDLVLVYKL
ncbi:hypothetical protein BASA81_001623 [Batrachochytrium salamandrivorans]|nr:hypothetical protein BASA81_001623 [Batrachochytrium salamandrivorans]